MLFRYFIWLGLFGLVVGCATPGTRDRVFTDDWADHVRTTPGRDRRAPKDSDPDETRQTRTGLVTYDDAGRPRLNIGDETGLGADINYRRGPAGRVRYRHQWDFARPERRQQ